MSIILHKHREETATYQVDCDSYLDDEESLTGTPTIVVEKMEDGSWVSKAGEFPISGETIGASSNGRTAAAVKFKIEKAAQADHQTASKSYRAKITVSTDGGQERVSDNPLYVFD